jgi:TonB family protein
MGINLLGRAGVFMSDSWKQWEGQVVDARFPLHRYLGGSEHSAVFLTERGAPPQKAAIKFVQVEGPDAELQLFRWKHAASLTHPHLLRTFDSGRCRLGDFDLLYVVMEYAEENLSQFLPQRPLTPAEARDVLTPALQALGFLHAEGLVHGHVRPSNILALDDQLKLSSEGISSTADHSEQSFAADPLPVSAGMSLRTSSPYDAPEVAKGIISPAGDIWSLGFTLVESLTQRLPVTTGPANQDPLVPDTLPAVFLDIARHCLHRDPQRRWTVLEISARLNPGSVPAPTKPVSASSAAPSAAAVAPPILPAPIQQTSAASSAAAARDLSSSAAHPVAKAPTPVQAPASRPAASRPRYDLVQPHLQRPPLLPFPKFNYLPLGIIGALALTAIFLGPRLLRHRAPAPQSVSVESTEAVAAKPLPASAHVKSASKSAQKPAPPSVHPAQAPALRASSPDQSSVSAKQNEQRPIATASPEPIPAALTSVANPPRNDLSANSAAGAVTQGEVLNQVLPDVSTRARATIRGTVHVAVKLHVDPTGNVSSAELFSAGPSRYFADQALQAAHQWDFAPAKVNGHAVSSDWLVRFEFTPSLTKAHPTQSTP